MRAANRRAETAERRARGWTSVGTIDEESRGASIGGTGLTRNYRRRAEVEAEICVLPAITSAEYRLAVARTDALEVFVYGIRQLRRCGDDAGAMELAELLIRRSRDLVTRAVRNQFPGSPADREEAIQEVTIQLWQEVLDLSPKEEFWEVHFRHMVLRVCSDVADKIRRSTERERPFHRSTDDEDPWDEEVEWPDPQMMDTDLVVPEALGQLDGKIRLAMWLHLQGFKIHSKKDEPTIASIMDVSGRTVQDYLRTGERQIRQWLLAHAEQIGEEGESHSGGEHDAKCRR